MSFKMTFVDERGDAELVDADAERIRTEVLSLDHEKGTFVIVKSLADLSGLSFAQVRPNDAEPEKCDFEYRDGANSRQLGTVLPNWSDGADKLLAWASGERNWVADLEWHEVGAAGLEVSESQRTGSNFDELDGLNRRARLDLQSAIALLSRNSNFFSLLWLWTDPHTKDSMCVLAAMMAPHEEVRVRDPRAAAARVNLLLAHERAKKYGLAVQDISDVSPLDFVVPSDSGLAGAPAVLGDLPLVSRSHLVDIWTLSRGANVGPVGRFWALYRTRQVGWHAEPSISVLIDHGLLRLCEDPEVLLDHQTMSRSAATLRELLTTAGIAFNQRASKSELANLSRAVFTASPPTEDEPLYELTNEGRRAVDWIKARADQTTRMWSVWAASRASE